MKKTIEAFPEEIETVTATPETALRWLVEDIDQVEEGFFNKYGSYWGKIIEKFEEAMCSICHEPEESFEKVAKVGPQDGIYITDPELYLYSVVLNGDEIVSYGP